jgi:AcrR family transcriptional regulator
MSSMSSGETILDAAERVFASHGYEGASMRQIAEQARVAQALLHYHFKSKEKLYAAVFARRSAPINALRKKRLDEILTDGRHISLEEVLDVLFSPPATALPDQQGTSNLYQQMVTAISVADDKRSKSLMTHYYDPIARRFIQALQKALPELSLASAVWAYLFALGARMQANARNDRASRLSNGIAAAGDVSSAHARILPFVAAGIRELAAQSHLTGSTKRSRLRLTANRPKPGRAKKAKFARTKSAKLNAVATDRAT